MDLEKLGKLTDNAIDGLLDLRAEIRLETCKVYERAINKNKLDSAIVAKAVKIGLFKPPTGVKYNVLPLGVKQAKGGGNA